MGTLVPRQSDRTLGSSVGKMPENAPSSAGDAISAIIPSASAAIAASLDAAFSDLDSNQRPEEIVGRLRELEASCQGETREHARLLQARGLALNRLGFDSLDDLHKAADIFQKIGDSAATAEVWRAIALVHSWRGNAREASLALLRTIAEASEDRLNLARAALETGRLEIEIGRPRDAHRFLLRGLEIGGAGLQASEICKARVNALQALVVLGEADAAEAMSAAIDLNGATNRLRHLTMLENARIALLRGKIEDADKILGDARALVPADDSENFSCIEQWHVEAEALFAKKNYEQALALISKVIARYFADDLPGREVGARILQSRILDELGRQDEADRTLAAALQQAVERQLSFYRDKVLEQLAARKREGTWQPGSAPATISATSRDRFFGRRPLGEGGFGTVERAYDNESGREVALKRLRLPSLYDLTVQTDRLHAAEMEVAAASRIRHSGVAQVFGMLRESDGDALLVREFVDGPTLREAMEGSGLQLAEKLAFLANFAFSLAAIHAASVVHRDLKPENVVLRNRDTTSPVIIDFGISVIGQAWEGKDAAKTLAYAAPEQMKGGFANARSDLYSFGVIGYEVFVGTLPQPPEQGFLGIVGASRRAKTIAQELAAVGIGEPLGTLITRLLSVSPQDRPSSAQDIALTIKAAMA
jgi:tRNA A-37 threonylcarbamoyl transferase component Bud32/tetratricopeptide (TPR) repeat protein